jgi:hypothetical protein
MKGGPARLLFFWDYDTQWGADRSRGPGGPKGWGDLEFRNTEELLEIHARYALPACFAVVGSAALPGDRPYHDPAQIRTLHDAGHEVASHSHRHEWLPALHGDALVETLRASRDALEQCTGGEVRTFVPPFNQPFDFPGGWSFSYSERREVRSGRTDLAGLCRALVATGYDFCRVAYEPLLRKVLNAAGVSRQPRPGSVERIAELSCVRMNTPGGFGAGTRALLARGIAQGGLWTVYGHPHSLSDAGSNQHRTELLALLDQVREWRSRGLVECILPRDLYRKESR